MNITPNEIESIEEAGMLDQSPVKLLRTKGGFWLAIGKPKGKMKDEALSAGSHPAIVKYNLQKQYPGFQPSLMKSEAFNDNSVVDKHSHFLSEELRKSGHDIYSVQVGKEVNFHVTKDNVEVSTIKARFDDKTLVVTELNIPKEFVRGLACATTEKAVESGAHKVKIQK